MCRDSGEEPQVSGTIRLMQRPLTMQCLMVEGSGGASELERHEEEEEARKGKKKGPPSLFIRQMDKWQARELRSLKRQKWVRLSPRSSGYH